MNLSEIKPGDKLYVVTRSDLSLEHMSVQSMHASHVFAKEYPEIFFTWYEKSNYIASLQVKSEQELMLIIRKARAMDIKVSYFEEPDIGNQITAITLEPSKASKKLCSKLELAFS